MQLPDRGRRAGRWNAEGESGGHAVREATGAPSSPSVPAQDAGARIRGRPTEEVVAYLSNGDPLRLAERCAQRARAAAVFVDPDRLCHAAIGRIAYEADDAPARDGDGASTLATWIDQRIDASITALLVDDEQEERQGSEPLDGWDARYAFVTKALVLQPEQGRTACVTFNGLHPATRRIFFALIIEGRTVASCVDAGLGSREDLRAACETGLRALLLGERPDSGSNEPTSPRRSP